MNKIENFIRFHYKLLRNLGYFRWGDVRDCFPFQVEMSDLIEYIDPGRVYIVMEYASNGSLLDVIRKEAHIDEARGRRWFGQLVDAVNYCHGRCIVHRYRYYRDCSQSTTTQIQLSLPFA